MNIAEQFIRDAKKQAGDAEHKRKLLFNISKYDKKVVSGKKQYADLPLARRRASSVKTKAIENLESNLLEFESNFIKNGGKIIWAADAGVAMKEIMSILHKSKAKS